VKPVATLLDPGGGRGVEVVDIDGKLHRTVCRANSLEPCDLAEFRRLAEGNETWRDSPSGRMDAKTRHDIPVLPVGPARPEGKWVKQDQVAAADLLMRWN
jgi:hypothetical protein